MMQGRSPLICDLRPRRKDDAWALPLHPLGGGGRVLKVMLKVYIINSAATLLGGSWVVINGVISPLEWVRIRVTLLITPLITTHEPPSTAIHTLNPPTPEP